MKICYKCKKELPLSDFYKPADRKHESWCKECKKKWQKEYNFKNSKGINHNAPLFTDEATKQYLIEHPLRVDKAQFKAGFANIHFDNMRSS